MQVFRYTKSKTLLHLFLLLSCVSHTTYINKRYVPKNLHQASISLVMSSPIHLIYQGDLRPEFGEGDADSIVTAYMLSQLASVFKDSSCFAAVTVSKLSGSNVFLRKPFAYHNKTLWFEIPEKSKHIITSDSSIPDYLFVISKLGAKSVISSEASIKSLSSVIPSKPLTCYCEFMLWDNKEGCPVAWGKAQSSDDRGFAVTADKWNRVTRTLFDSILKNTPFKCK